jgi:hypothetical protein
MSWFDNWCEEQWKKWRQETAEEKEQHCLHHGCPQCNGTGRKKDGTMCIHHLSCPCPKCTPKC